MVNKLEAHTVNQMVESLFKKISEMLDISSLTEDQLIYILKEHTVFSKQNTIFLEQGMLRAQEIEELSAELKRNLDEEIGLDEDHGEHHYLLYVDGIRKDLQLDTANHTPSHATCAFIGSMLDLSTSYSVSKICGAIYASESVAIPELEIMKDITQRYAEKSGATSLKRLNHFYDMHLSGVEQAHRDGLSEIVFDYKRNGMKPDEIMEGFEGAINSMLVWWESINSSIREEKLAA